MNLKLSATYRIQTQITSLILNLAFQKVGGQSLSLNLNPPGLHDRRFLSEWSSRPAPTFVDYAKGGIAGGRDLQGDRCGDALDAGDQPQRLGSGASRDGGNSRGDRRGGHPAKGGGDQQRRRLFTRADPKAEAGEFTIGPMLMALIAARTRERKWA